MHEHMSLQDFILSVFSIGTPFLICCYCCFKCTNKFLEENRNDQDSDDEYIESELSPLSRTHEESFTSSEEEYFSDPSPRTLRVIDKYGHYKPDYSDISSSESQDEEEEYG
jgi:hypothetical protein